MGAWGVGNFENDDALDWVGELEEAEDVSFVEETLRAVVKRGVEYLEDPEACEALAAAEVVAALIGAGDSSLPERVKTWVGTQGQVRKPELAQLALKVIDRIKTDSELKELWSETERAQEWYAVVGNLESRLKLAI